VRYVQASVAVATKRSVEGSTPLFHATVAYKQWVKKELGKRGWSYQRVIDEMKRFDRAFTLSTAGFKLFLKNEHGEIVPSNVAFMPLLNAALEIAPPNICDPTSPHSQLRDKFDATWAKLTPREQAGILGLFGLKLPHNATDG
jgi:hypothetical protein